MIVQPLFTAYALRLPKIFSQSFYNLLLYKAVTSEAVNALPYKRN